jgi:uncharacterized protein YlxW (UPF0749 family)
MSYDDDGLLACQVEIRRLRSVVRELSNEVDKLLKELEDCRKKESNTSSEA